MKILFNEDFFAVECFFEDLRLYVTRLTCCIHFFSGFRQQRPTANWSSPCIKLLAENVGWIKVHFNCNFPNISLRIPESK